MRSELNDAFPGSRVELVRGSLLGIDFAIPDSRRLPYLVCARQWLPNARPVGGESIRAWANVLYEQVVPCLPDGQPWRLHVEPHYGTRTTHRIGARAWHSNRLRIADCGLRIENRGGMRNERGGWSATQAQKISAQAIAAEAGRHRCDLVRAALVELLEKKRRHLLRRLRVDPAPFLAEDSLVQLLLTSPETGFLSIAAAPLSFEQRHLLSPFPKGEVAIATDKAAPSRAFAKLVEAEARLGHAIKAGDTCVDLGASPGSWTYVAANRGARAIAVDRSPLREDVMCHPRVHFQSGDAFGFRPAQPVDWLLCDVIAPPERTAELLLKWLRQGWCRNFVVTLKMKDAPDADLLPNLKRELPPLTRELFLTRLCANKKEMCVFGSAAISCSPELLRQRDRP